MEIKYNKLVGVDFVQSPNGGGIITPTILVMHYTAGYNGAAAISRFKDRNAKVSAHLVIDRDGKVTQMMNFNAKAWHAGPSRFGSVTNLNSHSIGFEFVNIGFMKKSSNGLVDAYGNTQPMDKFEDYVIAKNARVGSGEYYWPVYTQQQIDVGVEIAKACIDKYPIKSIVSHEEIDTRGWKTDPGPAFPMKAFTSLLTGGRQDEPVGNLYTVTAGSLNVRSGAGPQWGVFASLKRGDKVEYISRDGDWFYVKFTDVFTENKGQEGWVSSLYLSH